ncbi:MAG: Gfo/Idh/MocA family oxidoreductase [Candidatus Thorarchaeota archaeon]
MSDHIVELIVAGAGDRGTIYSTYALEHPDKARVIGVAEPRRLHRERLVNAHSIPEANVFTDWKDMAERERFADAVIIATQDSMHRDPAVAFANKGYDILLEKPMAPDEDSCRQIARVAKDNGVIFAVCHVLRYTRYTQRLREIIDSGAIGEVIGLDRLEPVGYWHQAHSFVRGNWRREDGSSFMLLAKSCHDLDWISYIVGRKCRTVSSFGSLIHFRNESKPQNAGSRCLDCDYERECPYSAKKIYFGFLEKGNTGWPTSVVTPEVTKENLTKALRDGPYGQCVYDCDNDVVDNQVVNMEFEGGATASFVMTAFTRARQRETRIFGTRGEIFGDGTKIHVHSFLTDETEIIDTAASEPSSLSDHGGGDYWLIHKFVEAVANNDQNLVLSGPDETLESHLMVFAAERSRRERRFIDIDNV